MYQSYEELIQKEKYLKLNAAGQLVIDYPEKLKILDFHTHMSNLLPGKQKDPTQKGTYLKYQTLPPVQFIDLRRPYWTDINYNKKYNGFFSVIKYSMDGIKIFNDMVNGGTFDNCFLSQEDNMIQKSVILPISSLKSDQSCAALDIANKYPEKFIPFCSVHPLDPKMKEKIHQYKKMGAKGFKLKITEMEMKNKTEAIINLLKTCYDVQLPVLFHTGAMVETQGQKKSGIMAKLLKSTRTKLYGELLKNLPKDFVFIFGHSGIQEYRLVAQYMKKFPSCYAEVSAQSEESIRYLMDEVGSERILFGSDWPALPQAMTLSRVLLATEDSPISRENILYKNAERILENNYV
ncbi:MAG: amidohydrolase family protein [Velocimicrobium sp.]